MPCIKIIDSVKVYVYLKDHNPPHFHVRYNEYEELIVIENLSTHAGSIPNKQRKKVIAWVNENENEKYLVGKWNEFNPKNKI